MVAAAVLVSVAVVTEDRPIHSLHLFRSRNTSSAGGQGYRAVLAGRQVPTDGDGPES